MLLELTNGYSKEYSGVVGKTSDATTGVTRSCHCYGI
jgi:hypothetical protein